MRRDHIITIEDPIEFNPQSSAVRRQSAGGGCAHRSFAAALRGALREDPDIILLGNARPGKPYHWL